MQKSTLSRTLRAIAAAVESLSQHELDALVSGKGKLVFAANDKIKDTGVGTPHEIGSVIERLNQCKDREEARSTLAPLTNRDVLLSLARSMKIHVVKHDRREDIENKVIEFVIGGKLRSEAIQTLNLKGGGAKPEDG